MEIYNLLYESEGRFSWTEIYNMPSIWRRFYLSLTRQTNSKVLNLIESNKDKTGVMTNSNKNNRINSILKKPI